MIRSYSRVLFSFFAVLGLASTLVACGEVLDKAPLNQLSKTEQEAAATRLKEATIRNLTDQAVTDATCTIFTIGFMGAKGTQAACEAAVAKCKSEAATRIAKQKEEIQKQTIDFSKCDAKFSELYNCIDKFAAYFKSEASRVSCADVGTKKTMKPFEEYAPECAPILKKCGTQKGEQPVPSP